uniref:Uncharacterized protein n=1 Tax=Amphiprion percula TaxID=161767 RepID=A0A3P8T1E4_AMPPE
MKFPVDLLADVSLAELERSAHNYMNNLLYSNPDSPEHLTTSASTKVIIDISSVGFIPLYGSDDTWKILALFSPSDPFIAVGLYLLDRWWAVEDILKTADPARDGVLEVETVGDRIVLYILNRVIYRGKEMTSDELPFLCHGKKDYAKIVWNNGEAVGFYSVKPSGTICNSFSVRTYQLSVMDSIFVRKCQRRKGFGLQMLVDFVLSFKEESLGLRYPVTKSMYKVCEKYLCQYPGDADLLWEVESIGGPKQRTNIARKIMAIDISVSKSLSFSEESLLTPDVAEKVLKETTAVECSVETMEEVTVLRATKEIDDVPVVSQRRSSHTKQRITGEKMKEDKSEKTIRIEEIEAETPRKERVSVQRKTELHYSQELEQTEVLLSVFKEKAGDVVDTVPEGGPTMRSNKPATVLTSGDLAEDHVTSATMTEEQHVEDDATQDLINKSHDSQITVENVASETQEAEVCEKEEEADIPFRGDAEENILPVELDEEMSRKDEETPANDEQVQGGYEEGKTVIESRVLRSGKKTVRATARIKTTKRQDGEQEEEADGVNTKGDKPAEDGVLREGRRSAATTRQQSKQAQEETTVSEEIQVDKTKAVLEEAEEIKETRDQKNNDNNEEEAAAWKNENPEPEVAIEQVEALEGVSLREQDTAEEEQSTASVTCADREEVASIQECAEETPDEGKVPSEEDAVADETTTVHQAADEAEEESTAAKEIHIAETKDSITEEIEEKDGEDDASQKDDTEDTLNTNVENVSDEIEAPALESRVLRGGGKLVTTTPVSKTTTCGHKQSAQVEMLVEKSADTDELAVETRILRKGRRSAPATSRRKSKRARIQCQPEEQSDEETVSAQEMEGEEGEVGQESPEKTGEKAEEGGKIMEMEIKPSNDAEQGEAESAPGEVEDSILPKSAPDSTVFSLSEEEAAPSAEEQQNEEMVCPVSGLQGLTVVLVDMKENVEVHKETAATEEAVPVEKIADEAEEEQSEETMKQEKTMPEEQFHDSSMEIEKNEIVEEEGLEEKVEDAVIMEDTGEGSAEETGGENNTKSDDEQNSTVNESRTPRGRKKQVTAPTGHESVRVLRSGRKSVLVTQTCTRKNTHKQIQKEESEEGEESPAAEGSDPEEEEEEAEQTSVIDQEKGEIIENDASQQEENPAAEMDMENMNTVAEEAVTQDVPVVGKADSTETITDEDAEALVGKADEGMTSDVVEKEAATGPETVEAEESTSEVEETAAGENSENKLLTSNDDHKEETPVIESRVLRSGTPKITATPQKATRSRKKADEHEAKNTKKEKSAVTPIIPRCGRKSANAPPKDESRRTYKQVQEEGQKGEDEPEGLETTGLGDELNATQEPVVEKTDEEIEGENLKEIEKHKVEAASEKIEYLELSVGVEEGKAVEDEQAVTEEGTIPVTEEENIATVTAAAGVLVQEEETDTLLLNPATDSAIFSLNGEEAAPSSKKQQSVEMVSQAFGLQRLTVVLVDMKKNVEVHKETAATEEAVPVEKIADEAEEEQSEETMKQEKTMPEEQFHDSSMEIEKNEIVEEEGLEEKVEDAVIMEDTGEGSAEETGGENNAKSDDEQNSTVNESRTPRGRKKQVTAPTGHESVRVLRSGRKSVLVTQTCTRKNTHKQIQKEESEEGEESPAAEGSDPEEEEEEAEQTSVIDQEKGEIIENDASQQEENPAAEMDMENMNTVAEEAVTQDVPVVGKADSTETITDEDAEALVGKADEGMTSDVVEKEAATGPETVEAEESTSEVEETAAGENSENKLLTSNDDHKEETPVIESRVLRSGKKIVRATMRIKTTKRQDDEQEEEADGVNTKGDKPAEDGVVREGRRSAATTRQQMEETTVTEEIQVDKTKAVLEEAEEIKETRDRKNDDNNEEEAAVQKHENPEPEVEIEQVEALEGVSLREQDTAEEEQSTASVTCADREEVASIQECAEETPDEGKVPSEEDAVADETTTVHQAADEAEEESTAAKEIHIAETKDSITEEIEEKDGEDDASQKDDTEDTLNTNVENVSDEIEAPAVESRVLRGGGKLVTTTPVSKTTKRGHKQSAQVEMLVEKSADTDELAVETRILRKGRRSAPATSRRKSKRARIQCQPEEQSDEETVSAQEMEGEEGEVGQESPEKTGEKAEEGGKIMEMEIKPSNDAEQGESAPGGEYVVADTEQMKDSMIEETAVIEGDRGDNSKTDLVETDIIQISSAEVEETNSVGEEGITNIEKSTPVTEVVSDTAIAEEEAEDECAHEVAEEDAPAATTMSLRSKTNTSHPRLTRRSRGQKTQEPVETKPQQMEEENLEDVETQEVPPMTDNSPEQREQKEEQTEAEEMSATGHEAGEDIAEYIDKETSDSRVVESLGDDTQSVDKEVEEKVESDEDKDNMTDDFSDNQHIKKLKDGSEEENLENAVKAGETGSILNSTLDIDEEVETQSVTQKQENDEQNMSEEEMESILIGKRVLRSRIVPSVIITPQSKSRRRSTKVQIAEESSSDEETSPQSSKRRSLRKRKSTDVTPAHKFKRSSRVQEVLQ